MTMQVIQHIELGSAASSFDFQSIPNTYTDLVLKLSARNTGNEDQIRLLLNNSSTNWTMRMLYGLGSGSGGSLSSSTAGIAINFPGWSNPSTMTTSTFSSIEFYIPNYAGSTAKSVSVDGVTENNATFSYQYITAMLWNDTSAVNRVTISTPQFNFEIGSSATLYGITKGSDGTTTVS